MVNLLLMGKAPRSFVLVICLFCSFSFLHAQSAKEIYEQEAIYLKWGNYVKNGEKFSIGIMGNKLLKELEVSDAAVQEGIRYKKNRNLSLVLSLVGLATVVVGAVAEEEAFLWSGLAVSGASIPFSIKAVNNMHKAVWLRNRDILR